MEGAYGYFGTDGARFCSLPLVVWLGHAAVSRLRRSALLAGPKRYEKHMSVSISPEGISRLLHLVSQLHEHIYIYATQKSEKKGKEFLLVPVSDTIKILDNSFHSDSNVRTIVEAGTVFCLGFQESFCNTLQIAWTYPHLNHCFRVSICP